MMRVSLIIPTYNEAENTLFLIEEILSIVDKDKIDLEFIIVDDNSPDGTAKLAEEMSRKYPVKVLCRASKMGLGSAVREGFKLSDRPYLGVIDADLSHDPKVLNDLIFSLRDNDIVIGSRFSQGSFVENWKWWRRIISNVGVFFAKKLTNIKDPLSGYFFLNRRVIESITLRTKGYKILLEILIKGNFSTVKEIPFLFRMRRFSTSKLNYSEYLLFCGQLIKYGFYKLYRYLGNKDRIYFLALFFLSICLLFYKLEARSFWMDEQTVLEYLYQTPNPFSFILNYFQFPDNHPPLYYFLVIILYKISPSGEAGIRLLSVLSSIGIVITVYYFTLLLFKNIVLARWAMFLTSVSSYFILISQMARYHSLAAFTTLLSLYYFSKIVLKGYSKPLFIGFLISSLLVCYIDLPHFVYVVAIINIYYLYTLITRRRIVTIAVWFMGQMLLLLSFLPIVYLFYLRIFGQNDMGFGNASLLGESVLDRLADFFIHFYVFFFGENILPWNYFPFISGLVILCILLGVLIRGVYKKLFEREFYLLLYLFGLLIILNTVFLNYADPRYNFIVYPKYVFAAFPLFIILIVRLVWQIKNVYFRPTLLLSCMAISFYGLFNFYQSSNYINGSYFDQFKGYRFVEERSLPGDYVVINGNVSLGLYNFYKGSYFKNLTPISFFILSSTNFKDNSRLWFFEAGSDGDAVYGSATAEEKVPKDFFIIDQLQSVPIDRKLLQLKQRITGRPSYEYKYAVYLLKKK